MITIELSAADAYWLRDHLSKIGGRTPTRIGKRLRARLAAEHCIRPLVPDGVTIDILPGTRLTKGVVRQPRSAGGAR